MTAKEQPLNQYENLEEILNEVASELSQVEWLGITSCLRIDPDKLHLVTSANGCDLQRQKTLGLLCWIEDEPKSATFEKLINALVQVEAKSIAGDLRNFCRLLRFRKASHSSRKVESLQTQYYSMQFTQYPQVPKSALSHGQWKFAEKPHPHLMCASPAVAFYPSKSVPSHSNFDLTSSVSIQGAKLSLNQRDAWTVKPVKKVQRPTTISTASLATRKRSLGGHKKSGQLEISTTIKTAIPLSNNMFHDCHPEEIQDKIAEKLFDYLLNANGSRETLLMVSTLESIDGLVVKKLRRGSLKIETNLHKLSALKAVVNSFESGQLNDMFQEQLISDTSLKMAGAFSISLETSINRSELDLCLKQFQSRSSAGSSQFVRRSLNLAPRTMSPPRGKNQYKTVPRLPLPCLLSNTPSSNRVTSVPHSRSVMVELAPSVRTVKPEPRSRLWKNEKGRAAARNDLKPGIVFSEEQQISNLEELLHQKQANEAMENATANENQSAPPPTPDILQGEETDEKKSNEESIKIALDDLNKRTNDAVEAYKYFDEATLRRLVDALKKASELGIDTITHVGDLRKYATILRQHDVADTAQLVEEFVKVTEVLDQIHRDVTSKIWLKVSENSSASAKSRDSTGNRRSPLRNRVTQSIEIWRQLQDPKYNFTELEANEQLKQVFNEEEITKYGGLLSHIPALLATAKSCHQLLNHYMHAP